MSEEPKLEELDRLISVGKQKGFLTYDGNHWTEAGHKYVAEQMLNKFTF